MWRVLWFLGLIAAAATIMAWLLDRPGSASLEWQGYRIETSVALLATVMAVIAAATNNARAGTNSISVSSLAKEQRTISAGFDTDTGILNSGNAIGIDITVNGVTETLSLESANLSSVATAINNANLGVSAEVINTGTGSGSYRLQLVGKEGSSNAFSVTSDFSGLSFETLQSASNAALNVNGVDFVRSTNQISDIIQGVP